MKRIALLIFPVTILLACVSWTALRTKSKTKYEISGTILIDHDYCGGARLSEDAQRHPYAVKGTKLYIRNATTRKLIDSVATDSAGNFKVMLPAGNYCFVEKQKLDPIQMPVDSQYEKWDTTCYRKEYNTCEYSVKLAKHTRNVKITLHRHCAWSRPCCSYMGPMPPAAPPTNKGGYQPGHQE